MSQKAVNSFIDKLEDKFLTEKPTNLSKVKSEDADVMASKKAITPHTSLNLDEDMEKEKSYMMYAGFKVPTLQFEHLNIVTDVDGLIKEYDEDMYPFRPKPTNKLHDAAYEHQTKRRFGGIPTMNGGSSVI